MDEPLVIRLLGRPRNAEPRPPNLSTWRNAEQDSRGAREPLTSNRMPTGIKIRTAWYGGARSGTVLLGSARHGLTARHEVATG